MKKIFSFLVCICIILAFSACTQIPEKEEISGDATDSKIEDNQLVGLPNPMIELTKEDFDSEFGASFIPEGSSDAKYFKIVPSIEDGVLIVEIDFTRFDHDYCFRYAKGSEQDISGMYYEWSYDKEDDKLNDNSKYTCHIKINETEGAGLASWYDENSKTNYSISMSEGATRELLLSTFESYYSFYCEIIGTTEE